MTMTPSKTLIVELHDQASAEAQYKMFDDNEHKQQVIEAYKSSMAAVRMCKKLNYFFPHVEGLNWADFDKFAPDRT